VNEQEIKTEALTRTGAQCYLTPEAASLFLASCEKRMVLQPDYGWPQRQTRAEVKWEGRWLSMGITTLLDQIGTYRSGLDAGGYREHMRYGAVITDACFFVIATMTDG
jgi:hypothetical protein